MDVLEKENYLPDEEVNKFTISRISSFVSSTDQSKASLSENEISTNDKNMEMAAITIQQAFKKAREIKSNKTYDLETQVNEDNNRDIHSRL